MIMQQARELGISAPLFVGNGNPTSKVYREGGGKTLEGVVYAGFKFDMVRRKSWRTPIVPNLASILISRSIEIYDMVNMVAEGIRKNGYDGEGIRSSSPD